jgi:hypothetical protein
MPGIMKNKIGNFSPTKTCILLACLQMLGFGRFDGTEGLGGQKQSNIQKT